MSHTLLKFVVLAALASPLPARADVAFQIVDEVGSPSQKSVSIEQLAPSPAAQVTVPIEQAGAGMAFVPAAMPADPAGNTSLIAQLGLMNTVVIEQPGLFNASLITQGGTGNDCTVFQLSNGNLSVVSQTGSNGFVSVTQGTR
ncbi:hypothetical protein [Novosphingobium sp.]|uniref:hypothetical protein n=1 Tax=Novosphingobium sp. TaxID=1874826 RepID=UPI0025DE1482|nr:hypothetical protein [Novosphingobium sp.]